MVWQKRSFILFQDSWLLLDPQISVTLSHLFIRVALAFAHTSLFVMPSSVATCSEHE